MLKVAINGYGTIGKRVADAISLQDDMQVVGIVKAHPDYMAKIASKKYKIYAPDEKSLKNFEGSDIKVEGTLVNLLDEVEAVVMLPLMM
jgi:Glyceraldehyde-3-phosphate dehydrogenase/erythrose-4-phosphate dehydrogenase